MFYLYGLQRSGTNVIEDFLKNNYSITFSNDVSNRNSPKHKHFRIYNNKNYIPNTDKVSQYFNNYIVNSLEELDILLNNTEHTNKYFIVYKDIYTWLPSICKWAEKCKWITKEKKDFINDYILFIEKWNSIKTERVLFINYNEYINFVTNNDISIITNINKFLNTTLNKKILIPTKVNCSSDFTEERLNYYKNKNYMKYYTKEEIELIKKLT